MTDTPAPLGWDLARSPFHEGELAIQRRVGVAARIDAQGRRAVRRYMTEQHREFFGLLSYAFVGTAGPDGQPRASMLVGQPGFLHAPDPNRLEVLARALFGDPLNATLREGADVALLGVQLPTRRRNRVIGTVADLTRDGFAIVVRQTLGVCPQYIQGRDARFTGDPRAPEERPIHRSATLDDAARAIIEQADTFFVASANPRAEDGVASGADVSHRGGRPGFVRVDDPATITTPDFVGNFIFNTLGNFQLDDRAGLFFPDFETGDTLYLAARAEVIWDGPEVKAFAGAQRLVRYHLTEVIRVERALPLAFSDPDWSPLLSRTGTWREAEAALEAATLRDVWRPFRVARVVEESADVRSFHLEPADSHGLAPQRAGQFLPIRLRPDGWAGYATRTYTLSDAPGAGYRISVRREGRGGISDVLHDYMQVGDVLEAMAPRGSFVFNSNPDRPVVLLSAGIGITPMLAMLNDLLVNNGRTRHHAPIWFVHGARDGAHHPFAGHLHAKAALHLNLNVHIRYSAPRQEDVPGRDYDAAGRVDIAALKTVLPFDAYDFYLCGPPAFMQSLYDGLRDLDVPDARIRLEAFGPASVTRRPDATAAGSGDEEAIRVELAKSGKTLRWRPRDGSLLDLVERAGAPALSSCRSGVCGTCAARVLKGAVEYAEPPIHRIAPDEALICVARPHAGPHLDNHQDREGVTLDL